MADLPTDALIASYCNMIYSPTAHLLGWDHYDAGLDNGVCWAMVRLPGYDLVVFRGSSNIRDWIRDIMVLPIGGHRVLSTRIGRVHAGFFMGIEQVWSELRPMLQQPAVIGGHSLGAARASDLCGLMVVDGTPPARRVVFGEPKPGLQDAADVIKDIPGASWRNGDGTHHDMVTDVPFWIPPAFEFVRALPTSACDGEPTGDAIAKLGPFSYHHMPLYLDAANAIEAAKIAA